MEHRNDATASVVHGLRHLSACSPAGVRAVHLTVHVTPALWRALCLPALAEEFTEFADRLVMI
jgi:hypothetical protein